MEEIIPKKILVDMLSRGANILANRQMGKTNLAQIIIAEMVRQQLPCQIKIGDTAQVWRHNFLSSFKVQEINERTRQVYNGDNLIYDIEYEDSERIMQFLGNRVLKDYLMNRQRKKVSNGHLNDWVLYCLEEAQNSLGSYSLNRQTGRIWLKMISEGANFNLAFIMIGQRPADISTKAIERMQTYWIGRTTGDNNTRKLKGIIGNKAGTEQLGLPLHEKAKELERGEFIFWNGAEAWLFSCPKFEDLYPNNKPELVEPPRSSWLKLW